MEELNLSTPILSNPDNESSAAEQKEEKNNFGEKQKKAFWNFFHKTKRQIKSAEFKQRVASSTNKFRNGNFRKYKKYFYPALGIVIVIITTFYIGKSFGQGQVNNSNNSAENSRPLPATTLAKQELNKKFNFPLKNEKGKKVGELTYKIETAELQDSIIVKGQRARAVKGRIFLILNIKIINDNSQGVQINSKDYVRLSVNNQNEWIAADIHNDPVEVQAISTKLTRLGFPINEISSSLRLQIGEIDGIKEIIQLKLK